MLFNFQLRPLQNVAPWGKPGDYSLSWFGLTDGWYWLNCGHEELFRYSPTILESWKYEGRQPTDPPYVDYQVARLWEDILDILPAILTPVPVELLRKLEPGMATAKWHQQIAQLVYTDEHEVSELTDEQFDLATTWLRERTLDSLYLKAGARIWFWTDGTTLFIRWDNQDLVSDGHNVWASLAGTFSMPIGTFLEEIKSFDRRLIAEMNQRVQAIQHSWDRPEIQIDKEALPSEQQERATALPEALRRAAENQPPPWSEITEAINYFEKLGHPLPKPR